MTNWRWRRLWTPAWAGPVVADWSLAATVTAIGVASVFVDRRGSGSALPLVPWVLLAGQGIPLAIRRRYPFAVAVVVGVARVAYDVGGYGSAPMPLGPLLAVYGVVAYGGRSARACLVPLTMVGLIVSLSTNEASRRVFNFVLNFALLAGAATVGELARQRRLRIFELAERVELVERREASARAAVAEERDRLARELHDAVAHHVSLIAVQAEAARVLLACGPQQAVDAVEVIGVHARQTMSELHELLGVLRSTALDEAAPVAPQAGIADVFRFADQFAGGGLRVDVTVQGEARTTDTVVDLAVYRIVQEALTNTLRHAHATTAKVLLWWREDELIVEVADNGVGCRSPSEPGGHGLIGMRERAALAGGSLTAGPGPDGGFAVRAHLPAP